jgi:hypothetical protein
MIQPRRAIRLSALGPGCRLRKRPVSMDPELVESRVRVRVSTSTSTTCGSTTEPPAATWRSASISAVISLGTVRTRLRFGCGD